MLRGLIILVAVATCITASTLPPRAMHPSYKAMVTATLDALKEEGGSSRAAIEKYLVAHFKVSDDKRLRRMRLRRALFQGVRTGAFVKATGTTFKLP